MLKGKLIYIGLSVPHFTMVVNTLTNPTEGKWESLEMIQRYTRPVRSEDSLKFYYAIVSESKYCRFAIYRESLCCP